MLIDRVLARFENIRDSQQREKLYKQLDKQERELDFIARGSFVYLL
jgi:hypothetical protein